MRDIREFVSNHRDELLQLIYKLAVIPAPSHHEETRAAFCLEWLHKNGLQNAYIDEVNNVICTVGDTNKPCVLLMAHTDIVFDADTPLKITEQDGRLYCPGIGDDTAHVAMLLLCAKYAAINSPKDLCLLFCANSCEEGQGNLDGCRALMKRYGKSLREVISFDSYLETINDTAVGSSRYRIAMDTEGGHSFRHFGNTNAIAVVAEIICALQGIPIPQKDITTFNFGRIEGGTTVNSIAQHCEVLYEFRSNNAENLAYMKAELSKVLANFEKQYRITVTPIGERPCAVGVDPAAQQALIARAESAFEGLPTPGRYPASTDCNLPLSMGIPAICIGLFSGGGAHSTEEYIVKDSLPIGLAVAIRLVESYL